jgi:hypothetical protein
VRESRELVEIHAVERDQDIQMSTPTYYLFVDDSGSRDLDKPSATRNDGMDCFALGGILIKSEDALAATQRLNDLRARHLISAPFHSTKMRGKRHEWAWLESDKDRAIALIEDLTTYLCEFPGYATACIVHRPGYAARYDHYKNQRWQMCKSAYTIMVERAAKFADLHDRRLAVYVEASGRKEDRAITDYHKALRTEGMFFNRVSSAKYFPLEPTSFFKTLLAKPKFFSKDNLLGQVADLMLYPLVKGRYDPNYRPYRQLIDSSRVINCILELGNVDVLGVKHFCFDMAPEQTKGPSFPEPHVPPPYGNA